jgi:hypothetical protein
VQVGSARATEYFIWMPHTRAPLTPLAAEAGISRRRGGEGRGGLQFGPFSLSRLQMRCTERHGNVCWLVSSTVYRMITAAACPAAGVAMNCVSPSANVATACTLLCLTAAPKITMTHLLRPGPIDPANAAVAGRARNSLAGSAQSLLIAKRKPLDLFVSVSGAVRLHCCGREAP